MDLNRIINKIFELYEKHGDNDYIGERVSQLEHALQSALLAEKEDYSDHVIVAAFLHDIGKQKKSFFSPFPPAYHN